MAESAATESVGAWVEILPSHWRMAVDGREVAGIEPSRHMWAWCVDKGSRHGIGLVEFGREETREQAMAAAELAVRL